MRTLLCLVFCVGLTALSAQPLQEKEDELMTAVLEDQEAVPLAAAKRKSKSKRSHHRHHRSPGPPGPRGPQGPQGPQATFDHFYIVNHADLPITLDVENPISFSGNPLAFGSSISQLDGSKILISKPGRYFINFVGNTAPRSFLGGIEVRLNGVSTGVTSNLYFGGAPLVVQQIVDVTQIPTTLELMVVGLGLSFSAGTSLTLSIMQIN